MSYWKPGKKHNSALKRDTERHRNQKTAYRNVQQLIRKVSNENKTRSIENL